MLERQSATGRSHRGGNGLCELNTVKLRRLFDNQGHSRDHVPFAWSQLWARRRMGKRAEADDVQEKNLTKSSLNASDREAQSCQEQGSSVSEYQTNRARSGVRYHHPQSLETR
jgi:hypothetical protein